MSVLNDNNLNKVAGGVNDAIGMPNPVSGLSYAEAMKKAKELGSERKKIGTSEQMSNRDYMNWWRESNKDSKEYLDHKKEVDDFIESK